MKYNRFFIATVVLALLGACAQNKTAEDAADESPAGDDVKVEVLSEENSEPKDSVAAAFIAALMESLVMSLPLTTATRMVVEPVQVGTL